MMIQLAVLTKWFTYGGYVKILRFYAVSTSRQMLADALMASKLERTFRYQRNITVRLVIWKL